MAISINADEARSVLLDALKMARDGSRSLPVEWISHARTVFALESKTYTPALATLLLAKAVNPDVDTMSVKVTGERSYSLRGLGHGVIVPAAVQHGFSLRTTGREPLNNQPWFRYERIDEFGRVKNRKEYQFFVSIVSRANLLTSKEAVAALAAFLTVAIEEAERIRAVSIRTSGLSADGVRIAAEDFLRVNADDRPRRLQAFAAACFDLCYRDVRTRRINDPSRDLPGDVNAFDNDRAILSVEVRGKPVPATEFEAFIEASAGAKIGRAVLFVDAPGHIHIEIDDLDSHSLKTALVHADIYESVGSLIHSALTWTPAAIEDAVSELTRCVLERLKEIEVTRATLEEWVRAVTLLQAR